VVIVAGAANGGIGAWLGFKGFRRAAPVAVIPLLLLLYPLSLYLRYSSDSKWASWSAALPEAMFVGLFVWVAGRVGQELGDRQCPRQEQRAQPVTSERRTRFSARTACFILLCLGVLLLVR
jgi:hypothetical protein